MKIIDDIWFTGFRGIVGIVIGEDEVTGERKAYVGIGEGVSMDQDIKAIAEYGCPLTPGVAIRISSLLNPRKELRFNTNKTEK